MEAKGDPKLFKVPIVPIMRHLHHHHRQHHHYRREKDDLKIWVWPASVSLGANSARGSSLESFPEKSNNLRTFTYAELKNATRNFSRSLIIGEGGFGCVYKGIISSPDNPHRKREIAVKQLDPTGLQVRFFFRDFDFHGSGHREWLTEVNVLGVVDHPNLVKLVGYCAEDDERGIQRLLIYEYMPTRTLSWSKRLRIALQTAQGLAYLHEEMDFQIIFRDLKTSNILLDEHWNAKLSDFGLARQGPMEGKSHVSTLVVGTIGYAAPEYVLTGRLNAKSDIWSYGVVLYELITGRRPMDPNRPKSEQSLLEWVKPFLSDEKKFLPLRSVRKLATVANRCLVRQPRDRPKMSEVAAMVRAIVDDAEPSPPATPPRRRKEALELLPPSGDHLSTQAM
ncbi:unnamed protein product [Spirodela intermedia]|uniref:Protein kinase domain-containing protein n=1 Tax=Spirodela intermedia TaxID=51605 RepID=A0A7I8J913_SPIIN|nr:unnamed protein product [Spirodela intermedia]CAA6666550.1 unnamed protein product [Spirodela intermedia]